MKMLLVEFIFKFVVFCFSVFFNESTVVER